MQAVHNSYRNLVYADVRGCKRRTVACLGLQLIDHSVSACFPVASNVGVCKRCIAVIRT